jgi:polyphosphate kinase
MAAKVTKGVRAVARTPRNIDLRRPDLYINRELSAIAFIYRVLDEARSPRHPLLDRVRFLSFVSRQVDEFLMIRYAGLQDQRVAQVKDVGPDGLLPGQQLDALRKELRRLHHDQHLCWTRELQPALAAAGIAVLNYAQLSRAQRAVADAYFSDEVFPVLTPLAVDPAHPFPHISNRSLNLAVTLRGPDVAELFARVKVPSSLPRLVHVPLGVRGNGSEEAETDEWEAERTDEWKADGRQRYAFVWIEQLIAAHLDQLFPGMEILASYPFRVLRDADLEIQQDLASDLLETVEQSVQRRRFGSVVSLVIPPQMPRLVRELLRDNLELDPADVMEVDEPLGLGDLGDLLELDRPDLKASPLVARVPMELRHGADVFSVIAHGDLLLHHPYDTFSTVADFIEAAAGDPHVVAIKQTLYRVGKDSPIVAALLEASARGKQVAAVVELKARFDEENNIEWARTMERAGVHVVYSAANMKAHAKLALVVRREGGKLRRYVHIGTGNYNASTARVYEDYALLTARSDIGRDVSNLFNALTGYARDLTFSKLLIAPYTMRSGLLERIDREIARQREGGAGHIIFKVNALVDPDVIRALYQASREGVRVDLIVRGMCCLRPGIPGVSEHIRVISVVGRFLEHSRIYYFANGGSEDDEMYIGSGDLMERNLDHRIEALVPIEDPTLRGTIRDVVLPAYFRDNVNAWRLHSDGTYERVEREAGQEAYDIHHAFARYVNGIAPAPLS